jgi:segregation and condensation protein B
LQKTESQQDDLLRSPGKKVPGDRASEELELMEAALYVAGRPLDINELCSVVNTRSKNKIRSLARTLIQDYSERTTALEVLELKDERFVLQLKTAFTPRVKKLVNRPLLSMGPLKTLSYIAYRQPVSQKRVIDVRGHHAYGHVKLMKDMGLIVGERSGRSLLLRTTEYFADYFSLSRDANAIKRELKQIIECDEKKEDAA